MVLIEGRNRELRKMFEEIGHHVEKIRRVGFGPLVLDLPPGELRELDEREIAGLERVTRSRPMKAPAVAGAAAKPAAKKRAAAAKAAPGGPSTTPKARR
jgi:23S rRNA pseudouridine2605 synthase